MWLLLRRPLLILLVLGCTVSMLASRRLSIRLIADGALSFAFVPFFQVLAFGVAYAVGRRPLRFSRAADRFFAGYTPWLLWMAGLCAVSAVTWPMYWSLTMLELSAVPAVAWSGVVDYHFFRDVLGRAPRAAVAALTVQRGIGSSDFHGLGPMGLCRTFVFARDNSVEAILEAIRARRTVVYGLNDKAYGDPHLVPLAEADARLRAAARPPDANGWLDWVSRIAGLAGLLGWIVLNGKAPPSGGAPYERA